jgi:hypothetical protein
MQGTDPFERFAVSGLEMLGIEADEAELAVIGVADGIYRRHIEALLAANLDGVEPEPRIDLGSAPRP